MSYITMDHAGWVEAQARAVRKRPTAKDRRSCRQYRGWLSAPESMNDFQRRAFDILGIVGGGIYNAPISWGAVEWHEKYLSVPWRNGLSTFDFDKLTWLVFLCHEARIRCEISPLNFHHLEIHLSARAPEGPMSIRHPRLGDALAAFWTAFPPSHSINAPDRRKA